nr:hypothetical protein [uncultured Pseudodesulfovibrio sp.]
MGAFITRLLVLLLLMSLSSIALAGEVWRITSLDWPPYSDSKASTQGKSIQKIKKLLEKENIEIVVEFYPWARARDVALQTEYIGYFPAWPEEVEEGFIASSPVDWSEIAVMTYAGSGIEWTDLDALFQFKVGLVKNYDYPEIIASLADKWKKNVDSTPNEIALLRKLSDERIKVAITSPTVMLYLARQLGIDNIRIIKRICRNPLVMVFRDTPNNRKRLLLLNRLIENSGSED